MTASTVQIGDTIVIGSERFTILTMTTVQNGMKRITFTTRETLTLRPTTPFRCERPLRLDRGRRLR